MVLVQWLFAGALELSVPDLYLKVVQGGFVWTRYAQSSSWRSGFSA